MLEAKLGEPPKTPGNSSVPPSQGKKANRADQPKREGLRKGSLGRKGVGRAPAAHPDETVVARPVCCGRCLAALRESNHGLAARYDKLDLPKVKPVATRVEQYAGHCQTCGAITLAPLPEGLEPGSPFSLNIVALPIYLRFTHALLRRRLALNSRPSSITTETGFRCRSAASRMARPNGTNSPASLALTTRVG